MSAPDPEALVGEFYALEDKRIQAGLDETETHRWWELRQLLGLDAPAQPNGYYADDGNWYPFPEEAQPTPEAEGVSEAAFESAPVPVESSEDWVISSATQAELTQPFEADMSGAIELSPEPSEETAVPLAANADFLGSPELLSAGEQGEWSPGWARSTEPVPESEPVFESEPVLESESVPVPVPVLEPDPDPDPVLEEEPVLELEPEPELLDLEPEPPSSPQDAPLFMEDTGPTIELAPAEVVPAAPEPTPSQPLEVHLSPERVALSQTFDNRPITCRHLVKGEHRVILHMLEGQVKRGLLRDVDLSFPEIPLETQTHALPESVPTDRIKAIFFMATAGQPSPSDEGTKIRVTFQDGRQVSGFSNDFRNAGLGFFIIPADARTNTARIFVYRSSLQGLTET